MPKASGSALRATLFTDIVGSTDVAGELGDARWGRLLGSHHAIVRGQLKRHGGREVDTAGDGFFALFERPADAIRCAVGAVAEIQELGVDIRAGIHFGEVETDGTKAHGMVVHTGARVMGQAGAAQIVVTQTVRDLVAGSRIGFADRGAVELKGVPGTWQLSSVVRVDDTDVPGPLAQEVARERRDRTATPGAARSRSWLFAGVVAAVVIVGAIVAAWAFAGSGTVEGPLASGRLAPVETAGFGEAVEVGAVPDALVVGPDLVWVSDRTGQVFSVPSSGGGGATSRGTGGTPTGLALTDDALWITNGFGPSEAGGSVPVTRLDTATGQVTEAFRVPAGSEGIATGAGAVWVASMHTGQVIRFDLVERTLMTIDLPAADVDVEPRPDAIAYSTEDDAVWVGDASGGTVYRIDAPNPQVVEAFDQPATVDAIAVDGDGLWATSAEADRAWRIDASSGGAEAIVDLGRDGCNGPTSVAVGDEGRVWVACSLSGIVAGVDTSTAAVTERLDVAGVPIVGGGGGAVWAAVRAS